jgi:carbamoyl-phosphate synthase large subunit
MRLGLTDAEIHTACKIDPWFLAEIRGIVEMEAKFERKACPGAPAASAD